MNNIAGKRILFFSQFFFGYENIITKKMKELGAEVILYDEMSVKRPIERALLKISPMFFVLRTKHYYGKILKEVKGKEIDYVLFIDCEMPDKSIIKKYREVFPKARFCLHMWDSVRNLKGITRKFKFFDVITTFDREDSEKYKIGLRPLFFSDEYRSSVEQIEKDYDLSFIGTIHSDRYRIIKKISSQIEPGKFFVYPYLQSRFMYYLYRFTKREFKDTKVSDFRYDKLDSKKITQIITSSKCVLDIQHPKQSGLTMRTLEMVGMRKKIITTNRDIIKYDFFYKNDILIIDREEPKIDDFFLSSCYTNLPDDVYEHYSIENWIIDVLGG